jgi:hypothetical protein
MMAYTMLRPLAACKETPMALIDAIRAQYPHPRPAPDARREGDATGYCVGGSLCLYYDLLPVYGDGGRFPSADELADILTDINPHLPPEGGISYAQRIIEHNDNGWFTAAWAFAAMALGAHATPREADEQHAPRPPAGDDHDAGPRA